MTKIVKTVLNVLVEYSILHHRVGVCGICLLCEPWQFGASPDASSLSCLHGPFLLTIVTTSDWITSDAYHSYNRSALYVRVTLTHGEINLGQVFSTSL